MGEPVTVYDFLLRVFLRVAPHPLRDRLCRGMGRRYGRCDEHHWAESAADYQRVAGQRYLLLDLQPSRTAFSELPSSSRCSLGNFRSHHLCLCLKLTILG
jgi:hypothetical protein